MIRRSAQSRSQPPPTPLERALPRWGGIVLLGLASVLYLLTLDNGLTSEELVGGDLITHQYAQVEARPSNAPGYPLYTMGGWLWFHGIRRLPILMGFAFPNPITILSSYSTIWSLIALWLLYKILLLVTRTPSLPLGRWSLAFLISAFYSVTYFFWYYATTTEQYSSAIAHTLAIVYFYFRWLEAEDTQKSERYLLAMAFLSGLTLAHMITVALIVPPLVGLILYRRPELLRRGKLLASIIFLALLPLVSYSYVYLRGRAHPEWWGQGEWTSAADWFWSFVSTRQGQDELSWGLEAGRPIFTQGFPSLIWQELSIPLLLIGLVGIAFLPRQKSLLLYLTLLLYVLFSWIDRFGNWFQVILPAYPLILIGVAAALNRLSDLFTGRSELVRSLPAILLIPFIIWRATASLPAANSRNRESDDGLLRPSLLLDQAIPPEGALFAETPDALGLNYLTRIWGLRSDLEVVSRPEAEEVLSRGRPLLVTRSAAPLLLSELAQKPTYLNGVTPDWVQLGLDPGETAEPGIALGLALGDGIVLDGLRLLPGPDGAPPRKVQPSPFDIELQWTRTGEISEDWAISLRLGSGSEILSDEQGRLIQVDVTGPVAGLRPFTTFGLGETVSDSYRLPRNNDADTLQVILYRQTPSGFENLTEVRLALPIPAE